MNSLANLHIMYLKIKSYKNICFKQITQIQSELDHVCKTYMPPPNQSQWSRKM